MGALRHASTLPELIDAQECADVIGCSVRHFQDRISKEPSFPKPLRIGRIRKWVQGEFNDWLMKQRER